jgi:hypothetical protein
MVDEMEHTPERLDAGPCVSSYAILGSIFAHIFIVSIFLATAPGRDWKLALLTGAVFVLGMLPCTLMKRFEGSYIG